MSLAACSSGGGGPAETVTVTGTATGASSTPVTATASPTATRSPHPQAGSNNPNIGDVPRSLRLDRGLKADDGFGAIMLCQDSKIPGYPSLAKRRASQFGAELSDSGDSYQLEGVMIMTDDAAAHALMQEVLAKAQECAKDHSTRKDGSTWFAVKPLNGVGAEGFQVASEMVDAKGKNSQSNGSTLGIARKGRTIVAIRPGIYFDTPITDPKDSATGKGLAAELKKRLTGAL